MKNNRKQIRVTGILSLCMYILCGFGPKTTGKTACVSGLVDIGRFDCGAAGSTVLDGRKKQPMSIKKK